MQNQYIAYINIFHKIWHLGCNLVIIIRDFKMCSFPTCLNWDKLTSLKSRSFRYFNLQYTEEEFRLVLSHRSIPDGQYPWIGIKDVGNNDAFVWTNGAEVEAGYTNWDDGKRRINFIHI